MEPWWARTLAVVGVNGFLVLYLLGAIPGLPSPILAIQEAVRVHAEEAREAIRVQKMICRGVWKDVPQMAEECGR